jgi:hypothetical protein
MAQDEGCKRRVYTGGSFSGHRCGRRVKSDGFCGIHSPEATAKRREKSDARTVQTLAKWDEDRARVAETARRAAAYPKLVAALRELMEVPCADYMECRKSDVLDPRAKGCTGRGGCKAIVAKALAGEPEIPNE